MKEPVAINARKSLELKEGMPGFREAKANKYIPPRTPGKKEEFPMAMIAEVGASGKKRPREDGTDNERSKKTKVCRPQVSDLFKLKHDAKLSAPEDTLRKVSNVGKEAEEPPKGLKNHRNACFANSALQGLLGVPELADFLQELANGTLKEIEEIMSGCPDLKRPGMPTRESQEMLRSAFAPLENDM